MSSIFFPIFLLFTLKKIPTQSFGYVGICTTFYSLFHPPKTSSSAMVKEPKAISSSRRRTAKFFFKQGKQ